MDTPKRQTRTGAVNFATAVAARRCVTIMKNEHAPSHWVTNKDKMAVKVIELYNITPLRIIRNIRDFLFIIITTIIIITIFYTQFSVCLCNNTSILFVCVRRIISVFFYKIIRHILYIYRHAACIYIVYFYNPFARIIGANERFYFLRNPKV